MHPIPDTDADSWAEEIIKGCWPLWPLWHSDSGKAPVYSICPSSACNRHLSWDYHHQLHGQSQRFEPSGTGSGQLNQEPCDGQWEMEVTLVPFTARTTGPLQGNMPRLLLLNSLFSYEWIAMQKCVLVTTLLKDWRISLEDGCEELCVVCGVKNTIFPSMSGKEGAVWEDWWR